MIRSFRHKGLQSFHRDGNPRLIRPDFVRRIRWILTILDAARTPRDVGLPGFHLHPLKGSLSGYWAVTVRANWRITFRFEGNNACDVDLVDYH